MSIIKWTDDYSVGISQLDNQHKTLVDLINRMFDAMAVGKGRDIMESVLKELRKYVYLHFQTEERIMLVNGFPGLEEHKAIHKEFITKVDDLSKKFAAGDRRITIEVVDFLKEWTLNHIKGDDKKYAAFFKEKGIAF